MVKLEINVLPLNRQSGRDQNSLPGVHVSSAPRRAARGRKNDRLIIYISFSGTVSVSREQTKRVLLAIEKSYYQKPGSVTSAVKDVIIELNETFLNRNVKQAGTGKQMIAYLSLVVIRGNHFYLAQSGPSHGFLINSGELDYLHDPQAAGRGLGTSRTPSIRFYQSPLQPGDMLLLTPQLPSGWNETTFQDVSSQSLGNLRRRLLAHAGDEFQGVLLETRQGKETITLISSPDTLEDVPPAKTPAPEPENQHAWEALDVPDPADPVSHISPENPEPESQLPSLAQPESSPIQEDGNAQARTTLLNTSRRLMGWFKNISSGLRAFLGRVLPGDEFSKLPTSVMVFSAVAVPIVVIAVGMLVYMQVGREQQYKIYMDEAIQQVEIAQSGQGQAESRTAWGNALGSLDIAERYGVTEDSSILREKVQSALDQLDGIIRMEFQPAIAGSLPASTKIRRMVSAGRDIYMLDVSDGTVIRSWMTGTGYELDPGFRCGPGKYGPIIVGEIIDIAPLPNSAKNTIPIVALDGNGTLLYCQPNEAPLAVALVTPDSNWGNPTAITVENGNLYVLDPLTSAVWIFFGEDNQFREAPYLFFIEEVPNMQGAIDISVSRDDLYILYADGHIVTCNYNALKEAPTHCKDPADYMDNRPGKKSGPLLEDARFFQSLHTQPPEPSLYFLDPINRSIFHFSLRLNLVQQYRPQTDLPEGLATAFAVSSTRSVFLAMENKVFIGFLP